MPALRQAFALATAMFVNDRSTLHEWGAEFAQRPEWAARMMASWFLAGSWSTHRAEVERCLLTLAEDHNYMVREAVIWGYASVLSAHFDHATEVFSKWTLEGSTNVRRAMILAVMPVVRDPLLGQHRVRSCLTLIEPTLKDRSPYVRKNLGPFAIGSAILNHHPIVTYETLTRWADTDNDEQLRWNVAMSVSASGGNKHPEESLALLDTLSADPRPYVWRAVATAARSLARGHPIQVHEHAEQWSANATTRHVGQAVLKNP
jgi:3-methyladenine DNA glycosylase AlkC